MSLKSCQRLLSALGLAALLPYALPISGDCVVNARLAWVHAPIQGHVRPANHQQGHLLSMGEPLGEIVNPRVDTARIDDLITRRASIAGHRESLRQELAELEERIEGGRG